MGGANFSYRCSILSISAFIVLFHLLSIGLIFQSRPKMVKRRADGVQTEESDDRKRILVIIPTVPYYKGADHRLLHVIKYLSTRKDVRVSLAYYIKLQHDTPSANDTDAVILNIVRARYNIDLILGPLGDIGLAGALLPKFDVVLYWHWYNSPYLDMILRSVRHMQILRGQTRLIAFVDDDTVSFRAVAPSLQQLSRKEIQDVVLSLRPKEKVSHVVHTSYPTTYLLQLIDSPYDMSHVIDTELESYQHADDVVTITASLTFVQRFVEGHSYDVLRYSIPPLSPTYILPTEARRPARHLIFVGYFNFANNSGLKWFINHVLHLIRTPDVVLHVIGHVACFKGKRRENRATVICEGKQDNVDAFYHNVSLAINPALEEAGIATKTSEALKRGVPVITNELDGTVKHVRRAGSVQNYGVSICPVKNASCTAASIDRLLGSESLWLTASKAARKFIRDFFTEENMFSDLERILNRTLARKLRILIISDVNIPRTRLNFVKELSRIFYNDNRFSVYFIGMSASILDRQSAEAERRIFPDIKAVPTGKTFNFVIQLTWPPDLATPPTRMCGARCRLILWLPWQMSSLPVSEMASHGTRYDMIWTPSENSARLLQESGIDPLRIAVMPEGVNCNVNSEQHLRNSNDNQNRESFRFVYTGEDVSIKDFERLIISFKGAFSTGDYHVSLIFLTDVHLSKIPKEDQRRVEQLLQTDKRVTWYSTTKKPHETQSILENAGAIILPSCALSRGLSVIEAMSYGVPIIHSYSNSYILPEILEMISYPIPGELTHCTEYPCMNYGVCLPCLTNNSSCCFETTKQPHCNVMDDGSLRQRMLDIVDNRDNARELGLDGRRYVRQMFCWKQLSTVYTTKLMISLDSPSRIVGKREPWMIKTFERIIGPYSINDLSEDIPILRSSVGTWQLDILNSTAQLIIRQSNDPESRIHWMSPQTEITSCFPSCSLELTIDCKLILRGGDSTAAWSTDNHPVDYVTSRHQCFVELRNDGILLLYSIGKNVQHYWSSQNVV